MNTENSLHDAQEAAPAARSLFGELRPRERLVIIYTNGGGQWSVMDDGSCGMAIIELDNEDGQQAWEEGADGDFLVEAARDAGTLYPFTSEQVLRDALAAAPLPHSVD